MTTNYLFFSKRKKMTKILEYVKKKYYRRYAIYKKMNRIIGIFLPINYCSNHIEQFLNFPFIFPAVKKIILEILFTENKHDDRILNSVIEFSKDIDVKKYSKFFCYTCGDFLIRNRVYSKNTYQIIQKSIKRNPEITANFRAHDYIVQRYGYKSKKLKIIILRLKGKKIYGLLRKNEKAKLAILLYQHGYANLANKIIRVVGIKYIENAYSSMYLVHHGLKNKIVSIKTDSKYTQCDDIYINILKTRKLLEKFFIKHKDEICIIGNSPCELGLNKGAIIDSFKYPIRINNYSLDYPQDYGSKEYIWVRVANKEVNNLHIKNNQCCIIAGNNFAVKRKDSYQFLLPPYLNNSLYTVIPSHIFRYLISELGGLPSTGLAILYWIYQVSGPLSKEQVFGFSHISDADLFEQHYYANTVTIGTHRHRWIKEINLFNKIIK